MSTPWAMYRSRWWLRLARYARVGGHGEELVVQSNQTCTCLDLGQSPLPDAECLCVCCGELWQGGLLILRRSVVLAFKLNGP